MQEIFLPNGMEAIQASNTEYPLDEFNQNPFIQALPPLADMSTIIKKLAMNPLFAEQERQMESVYRLQMISRLYQFFQPLPIHLEIWDMINNLLIQGYLARNPFDPAYKRYLHETGKQIINRTFDINSRQNFRTTAGCGTLIGLSGMGKTTSVGRVLSNIPQVVIHNEYRGQHFNQIQLVWIKLDAPSTSSLKALCLQFFMRVDELLGTNNYKKYVSRNASVDMMLPLIGQLAQNIGLGLLIIDETQNIKGRGADQIMNFFVNLINSGVNLAIIGTPGAYGLFGDELRIARRLTGNSEIIFNNMDYDNEFKFLLESIWRYQWIKKPAKLTEEFAKVIYDETQGISDLIVKIFVYSQQKAISTGKEELTVELMRNVANEKFKLMREMLKAIRSGNPYKIAKYEDIRRIESATIQSVNEHPRKPLKAKNNEKSRNNDTKVVPTMPEVKKAKRNTEYAEGDLRLLLKNGVKQGKTPYEVLLEHGSIDDMVQWNVGVDS
ncbi:ATP-binding protein [Heyndrickxia oleronia]|uniref:ATP-binding protein n=1 Tax=Heyndrickxia oleronia TaxID=38875 RepID=UPI00242AF5DC|nr:ATP-binding protein [Heyndrickxia oleronia]MCI1589785.1 ATP-binding protein [Heyndrickxia oleronia]MCI1613507.1 ATP-binding protein [Heyndrickxia oleronia]MCI1744378.1 ATP-binding protein [Heyndrickxia oleronia]MCI1763059.1 ATP-binding protein [Heyndrickxia oleronia]